MEKAIVTLQLNSRTSDLKDFHSLCGVNCTRSRALSDPAWHGRLSHESWEHAAVWYERDCADAEEITESCRELSKLAEAARTVAVLPDLKVGFAIGVFGIKDFGDCFVLDPDVVQRIARVRGRIMVDVYRSDE